jgi:hypothetical protein
MGSGEWRTENGQRHTGRSVGLLFVRKHPALALTLAYLAITVVGRLDDLWFFQFFKINIFYYSSPEDFFLAPMRNPIVVLFLLVPALIILLFAWIRDSRSKSDQPATAPALQTNPISQWWSHPLARLAIGAVIVVATAALLTQNHATRRSSKVMAGVGRRVSFERADGVKFGEEPLLLGSTGKFFFLYYPDRKVTEIVPVENTALMTVDAHTRSDSATGDMIPEISKQTSSLTP